MTKTRENAPTNTHAWLLTPTRGGSCRIERLGWTRLAAICRQTRDQAVRRAIRREAERCGYDADMILHLAQQA